MIAPLLLLLATLRCETSNHALSDGHCRHWLGAGELFDFSVELLGYATPTRWPGRHWRGIGPGWPSWAARRAGLTSGPKVQRNRPNQEFGSRLPSESMSRET